MAKNIFAVRDGDNPMGRGEDVEGGVIYNRWTAAKEAVEGTKKTYKGFYTAEDALDWLTDQTFERYESPEDYDGLVCYVDGSGGTATDLASWAVVVFDEKGELMRTRSGVLHPQRRKNIAGELTAASEAVLMGLEMNESYLIVCDYMGVISYAEGDWETDGDPIVQDYMETTHDFPDRIEGFCHVDGHTGVRGNEIADVLAWNTRLLAADKDFAPPKIKA